MNAPERILRLAESCIRVADSIESGRIRMKDLRRSHVFFDNGACGCAFGHAIDRSGLKKHLAPFFTRGSAGGKSARWLGNAEAYVAATGAELDADVEVALIEVELANDVPTGGDRRDAVIDAMRDLATVLLHRGTRK